MSLRAAGEAISYRRGYTAP